MFSSLRRILPVVVLVLGIGILAVPAALAQADHLLLSEIATASIYEGDDLVSPFVEIINPTDGDLLLDDVYLTDATYASSQIYYYKIVTGVDAGGGTGSDFHCRFPMGSSIAAGDTLVISLDGSTLYETAFGKLPDFELFEDGDVLDQVPDMRPALPNSILGADGANVPQISYNIESLVLYYWDGQSDLVQDIDYIVWGDRDNPNPYIDKTAVSIDGPDAGEDLSTYADETDWETQDERARSSLPNTATRSFYRSDDTEYAENATGGNGITGNDETSEDFDEAWVADISKSPDPPMTPNTFLGAGHCSDNSDCRSRSECLLLGI